MHRIKYTLIVKIFPIHSSKTTLVRISQAMMYLAQKYSCIEGFSMHDRSTHVDKNSLIGESFPIL